MRRREIEPVAGKWKLMGLDGGVHATGNGESVLGSEAVSLPVIRFGFAEIVARRVQVAQRQVRRVVAWMCGRQPQQIFFGLFVVAKLPRHRSERRERQFVVGIQCQELSYRCRAPLRRGRSSRADRHSIAARLDLWDSVPAHRECPAARHWYRRRRALSASADVKSLRGSFLRDSAH